MCGIAGIISFSSEVNTREVQDMTDAISHRGPDGSGIQNFGKVCFGHRRLSIIDLAGGSQPMADKTDSVHITFNGEIYNFVEIRKELQTKGYNFKTKSDTEVIIYAYIEWGIDCIKRLRGMFALSLYDQRKQKVFLVRDHLGIKPVFYRKTQNKIAFCSELDPLVNAETRVNAKSVDLFLRYQYIPAPNTIYNHLFKLEPGNYLEIDLQEKSITKKEYWTVPEFSRREQSVRDWEQEVEEQLTKSVRSQMVSDVPFGLFLSGGIDSTLVALKMAEASDSPLKAFTVDFGHSDSEIEYAKTVSSKLGIELIIGKADINSIDLLPELVKHYGEPFGDNSVLPTFHVCKLAREHVPMVLSGDGGDEFFGGYDSYLRWLDNHPFGKAKDLALKNPVLAGRYAGNGLKQLFKEGRLNNIPAWQRHILYADLETRKALWKPGYRGLSELTDEVFNEAGDNAKDFDRLSFAQYVDIKTYLPNDILFKVDVASMYHGLEVRPPLLDIDLLSLASRIPFDQKITTTNHGVVSKSILKKIAAKHFSEEFVYRKKKGFSVPISSWFRKGEKAERLLDLHMNENPFLSSLFEKKEYQRIKDIYQKDGNHGGLLWLLLVLGTWADQKKITSLPL